MGTTDPKNPNLPYDAWNRDVTTNWSVADNWTQGLDFAPASGHVLPQANEVALLNPLVPQHDNSAGNPFSIIDDITTTVAGLQITEPLINKKKVVTLQIGNPSLNEVVTLTVTGGITYHYPSGRVVHDSRNGNTIAVTSAGTLVLGGDLNNAGGLIRVDNLGLVNFVAANVTKGKLVIKPGGVVEASGSGKTTTISSLNLSDGGNLQAIGGATLDLKNLTITGAGFITANAATVLLDAATIVGQTLATSAGGAIQTAAGTTTSLLKNTTTIAAGGLVKVLDGTSLNLLGTITNHGEVFVDATGSGAGDATHLVIGGNVQLDGGGQVVLSDSPSNAILGGATTKLTNVDNTIAGAGRIGDGSVGLALLNEGTIDATGTANTLEIDISAGAFTNKGLLEAQGAGGLVVDNDVTNPGGIIAAAGGNVLIHGAVAGGHATIAGSTLEFGATANAATTFTASTGTLKLDDAPNFTGLVSGLTGDGSGGNVLDFADIAFATHTVAFHENAAGTSGRLVVSDGTNSINLALLGNYAATINPTGGAAGFVVTDDGHTGTQVSYLTAHAAA